MRPNLALWILALLLAAFFSWPTGTSAHGDEDHGEHPRGGCASTP